MENESLEKLAQEIRELSEFIHLIVQIIEKCGLKIIYPNTLDDYLAGYVVRVKTQKGIFPITILSGNGERALVSFIKIRDYMSQNSCSGVIVTKEELTPSVKMKVKLHNESNKENKIYLIFGTKGKELEGKLLEVLR